MNGMIHDYETGKSYPGAILKLWNLIRADVGTIHKVQKKGMKFETLSSENVIDKVREACNEHGVLIYPSSVSGHGLVIEDGTLCDVNITFNVQAIEDGSFIQIAAFGLGADSQDKAGGKAGTYALKQALVQALLAGGSKKKGGVKSPDTDDTDAPIAGGVRAKSTVVKVDPETVRALFELAQDAVEYDSAMAEAVKLQPDQQVNIKDSIRQAGDRIPEIVERRAVRARQKAMSAVDKG